METSDLRLPGEKLEMQLYEKNRLYLKRSWVQLRKPLEGWHPPPPGEGEG